jgi:hypothetical protein
VVRSTGVWWENTRRRVVENKMMDGQESKGKGGDGNKGAIRWDVCCHEMGTHIVFIV